jgi:hypothetical protein
MADDYCSLNATIGSTIDARRAGMNAAMAATPTNGKRTMVTRNLLDECDEQRDRPWWVRRASEYHSSIIAAVETLNETVDATAG